MLKFKSKERKIFFAADFHYNHKNICRGVSEWENKEGCRDFDSLELMNECIIESINNTVSQEDVLIFVGDWSFGGKESIFDFRQRILCKEIYFIAGNHDDHIINDVTLPNCYWTIDDMLRKPQEGESGNTPATALFSEVHEYLKIIVDKQEIILSHFPMVSWDHSYKGSWMIHGHCHGTLNNKLNIQWVGSNHWYTNGKIFDVGIDNLYKYYGSYSPIEYQQLRVIMDQQKIISIDHHDNKTRG
jgi:calcineurin-like phosphoesterase family protein